MEAEAYLSNIPSNQKPKGKLTDTFLQSDIIISMVENYQHESLSVILT
jgi:hypothetical protein